MHACTYSTKNTRKKLTRWLTDTTDNKSSTTITALLHLHHRFSPHPPTEILFSVTAAKITAKIRVTNLYQIQVTRCKWVLSVFLSLAPDANGYSYFSIFFKNLQKSTLLHSTPNPPTYCPSSFSTPLPNHKPDKTKKKDRQRQTNITKTQTHFPILFCCWSSVFDFYLWTSFLPSFLVLLKAPLPTLQIFFLSSFHPTNTHTCSLLLSSVLLLTEWMNDWNGFLSFFADTTTISFFVGFLFVFFVGGVLGLVWGFLGFFLLCVCFILGGIGGFVRVRMEDSNAVFFVFLPFPTHFLSYLLFPPLFVFTWWCLGLPKCTLSVSGLFGHVFFKSSLLGPR